METLHLKKDHEVKFSLDDDEKRWIAFNPRDLLLQNRVRAFYMSMKDKQKEYEKEEARFIEIGDAVDENSVPVAGLELIALQGEFAKYIIGQWDGLFGEGCFQRLFDNVFDPEAVGDVLSYIVDKFNKSKEAKIDAKFNRRSGGKKVMR